MMFLCVEVSSSAHTGFHIFSLLGEMAPEFDNSSDLFFKNLFSLGNLGIGSWSHFIL